MIPEIQNQPPGQRMPPFSIGIFLSASEQPEFIRRVIRFCFLRIVLLVIYILLAISR